MKQHGFSRKLVLTSLILVGTLVYVYAAGRFNSNRQDKSSQQQENLVQEPQPQRLSTEGANIGIAGLRDIGTEAGGSTPKLSGVAKVAQNCSRGVVGISVILKDGNSLFQRDDTEQVGIGTGVMVSKNGYILTNNHVIAGNTKQIIVSLPDGSNEEGFVMWTNAVLDIAIVKIDRNDLNPIPLGNSDNIVVGETAIAIGNPLGLQFQRSVTSGVISAINRTIRLETEEGYNYMEDLIQTDASINPGNSGGPLLNDRGEVIGINTVKVTSAEAIGFAVPINIAVPVIKSFIEKGEFSEPYLGVFAYDRETIPVLNKNVQVNNGIYVASVDPKGPASKAGIKKGCIIQKVDGKVIDTMVQLRTYIYSKNPGDVITVTHLDEESNTFKDMQIQLSKLEK